MTTIYWLCFLIGGVFVVLAALGGIDDVDFDFEVDPDLEIIDPGEGPKTQAGLTRRQRRARKKGIPILGILKSLKFWTFGSCFFGLTGLVLSSVQSLLSPVGIVTIAVGMGLLCGISMAWILLALRRQQADSLIRAEDLVGLTGTVEIPFDATQKGKVRLQIKGSTVDFVALTDEAKPLSQGDPIVVMGTKNNRVWVVSAESFHQISKIRGND